jgi:hypothetical protein
MDGWMDGRNTRRAMVFQNGHAVLRLRIVLCYKLRVIICLHYSR